MARSCGDLGDGFRETDAPSTTSTIPSATPNLDQPCSLISIDEAAEIIGVDAESLDPLQNSEVGNSTLRCRFSSLTEDKSHFVSFNVFIYKDFSEYNRLRDLPASSAIQGDFDSGFNLERMPSTELDRLVGAQVDDVRLAVSSNLAVVKPDAVLDESQYEVLDFGQLQAIIESIFQKLNS